MFHRGLGSGISAVCDFPRVGRVSHWWHTIALVLLAYSYPSARKKCCHGQLSIVETQSKISLCSRSFTVYTSSLWSKGSLLLCKTMNNLGSFWKREIALFIVLHCCDKSQKHLLGCGMPGGAGKLDSCPEQLIVLSSINWSSWPSIEIILLSSGLPEVWEDWACKNWMFKKRRVFFLHLSGWLIWFIAGGIIISDCASCLYFVKIVCVFFFFNSTCVPVFFLLFLPITIYK